MIPIIFLDIDGVLNNAIDSDHHESVSNDPTDIKNAYFYSPRCVNILNNIIQLTGAKIVVSSVWRCGETLQSMQDILTTIGVEGECIGLTPDYSHHSVFRGNEIHSWIHDNTDLIGVESRHDFKSYLILDDDSDMLLWQKDNFLQVDGFSGLTPRDAFRAITILNGKEPSFSECCQFNLDAS